MATQDARGAARIRFGVFEADLRTQELRKSGRKLRLPNQSFRVLALLLERQPQLVTRDELRDALWPGGKHVEYDQGLNAAVNRLRETLGDSADEPRFVETLPKRGYRFIAPTQRDDVPPAPPDRRPPDLPPEIPNQPASAALEYSGNGRSRVPRGVLVVASSLCAVLAITSAIVLINFRSPANRYAGHRPVGREVVPFTSFPGQEIAPTFSPDGSQIAFAWNGETGDDHSFHLYVKAIGSERLLRLTHQPSQWISPAWSPDGGSIAFVRASDHGAALAVVPALGGAERRIVSDGVALGHLIQISWSPDGRRLAYSAYGPSGAQQIYLASLDTLNAEPLTPAPECLDAAEPAFSPNGKQLAFICTSSRAVYAIHVVGVPHGPPRHVVSMMGYPQGLAWSADGNRLIFSNDSGGGGELWQVSLDGELEQLRFGEDGSAPTVSAKGDRIAYTRVQSVTDIWRVDLTSAHPAQKLIYSTRAQMFPRYSQDGAHIAFQSNRSGSTEIWTTNARGADPVRLTSFNGPLTSAPSWCSDGRRIAFDSRAAGVSSIYIEDIEERLPRKVETSGSNLSFPVWSEDCRWLFASDGRNVLYRFSSSGGPAERFTQHLSYYAVVVGSRLIFNVMQPNGVVLWTKPVNGGPEEPLPNLPRLTYTDAWTATTTGIYYTDASSGPPSVNFYDFASKATRQVLTLRKTPAPGGGHGIAVSPDDHWLLFTEIEDEQSDIMLAPSP